MFLWLNWREIEKHNDFSSRGKDDYTAGQWGKAFDLQKFEINFADAGRYIAKMPMIDAGDSLIDVCCGPGALAIPLAQKVRQVTGLDFSDEIIQHNREAASKYGCDNINFIKHNWYSAEPGRDFPLHDIAITRCSPAHADILKLSCCATKYCYSIMLCAPGDLRIPERLLDTVVKPRRIVNGPPSADDPERQSGRYYGYNVHFNILYDMGADPTLDYVSNIYSINAPSREELYAMIIKDKELLPDGMDKLRERGEFFISDREDGSIDFRLENKLSILGWNPQAVRHAY